MSDTNRRSPVQRWQSSWGSKAAAIGGPGRKEEGGRSAPAQLAGMEAVPLSMFGGSLALGRLPMPSQRLLEVQTDAFKMLPLCTEALT